MKKSNYKPQIPDLMEAVFDAVCWLLIWQQQPYFFYLKRNILYVLYGILTLTLCGGDAFHLVPRIIRAVRGTNDKIRDSLELDCRYRLSQWRCFIFFNVYMVNIHYPELKIPVVIEVVIWISAVIRIVICMFPQNNWCTDEGNMKLYTGNSRDRISYNR